MAAERLRFVTSVTEVGVEPALPVQSREDTDASCVSRPRPVTTSACTASVPPMGFGSAEGFPARPAVSLVDYVIRVALRYQIGLPARAIRRSAPVMRIMLVICGHTRNGQYDVG